MMGFRLMCSCEQDVVDIITAIDQCTLVRSSGQCNTCDEGQVYKSTNVKCKSLFRCLILRISNFRIQGLIEKGSRIYLNMGYKR